MRFLTILSGVAALVVAPSVLAREKNDAPEPTEIMILGSYHFANPGLDKVNMEVDDVLAPKRQREIEVLARTLAEWMPTHVLIERQAEAPDFKLSAYANADALLKTKRGEGVQIGFRIAKMLDHNAVYGFDEQPSDGEPDYFPMGKVQQVAGQTGQSAIIANLFADLQTQIGKEQAKLPQQTIAESLLFHNDPKNVEAQHDLLYYSLLQIGDGEAQAGAELNAFWYMRNAKMFGKIDMIAEPGDRVLVIVGSGHATWLRHFARRVPGYKLAESQPYLIGAAAVSNVGEP